MRRTIEELIESSARACDRLAQATVRAATELKGFSDVFTPEIRAAIQDLENKTP